jgi:hypothetical protein
MARYELMQICAETTRYDQICPDMARYEQINQI